MVSSEDRTEINVVEVGESNSGGEERGRHRGKEKTKHIKLMKEKNADGITYSSTNLLHLEEEEEEATEEQEKKTVEVLGRILYTPPRKVRSGFSSILFSHQSTNSNPSLSISHHNTPHHPSPPNSSSNMHHNTPQNHFSPNSLHNSSSSVPHHNAQPNSSSNVPYHNTLHNVASSSHAHAQLTVDCKIEALCKNIVSWLNSLRKMNFVIEDVAMNLLIINSPHIWVSVHRDHSTRRSYAKREWAYKLFGKTCNISEKNIGHAKSAKVMGDFIQWRISLPPSITVIKSLSNSPYSSFVLALYQP